MRERTMDSFGKCFSFLFSMYEQFVGDCKIVKVQLHDNYKIDKIKTLNFYNLQQISDT